MRLVRKLLLMAPVALAVALAGCQTAGPAAKSAAARSAAAQPSTARPPISAAKTDVVMGVGF
jgi:hypothetical protein